MCGENRLKIAMKRTEVKCSDVNWNGSVGNLNEAKPKERVGKCVWVKVKWEEFDKCSKVDWSVVGWTVVKRSEGFVTGCLPLLEDIYIYIYDIYIYIYHMKFAAYMAVSFITFFHILLVTFFITLYMVVCFVCLCLIT
jgi:hypothetical protein